MVTQDEQDTDLVVLSWSQGQVTWACRGGPRRARTLPEPRCCCCRWARTGPSSRTTGVEPVLHPTRQMSRERSRMVIPVSEAQIRRPVIFDGTIRIHVTCSPPAQSTCRSCATRLMSSGSVIVSARPTTSTLHPASPSRSTPSTSNATHGQSQHGVQLGPHVRWERDAARLAVVHVVDRRSPGDHRRSRRAGPGSNDARQLCASSSGSRCGRSTSSRTYARV